METFLLVFAACVLSVVGTGVGCLYLVMRSGGLLERLDGARSQRLNSLSASCLDLETQMVNLETTVQANQQLVTTVTNAIGTRMASFESRFGKYAAKTEKQVMIEQAFSKARQLNNGVVNESE